MAGQKPVFEILQEFEGVCMVKFLRQLRALGGKIRSVYKLIIFFLRVSWDGCVCVLYVEFVETCNEGGVCIYNLGLLLVYVGCEIADLGLWEGVTCNKCR